MLRIPNNWAKPNAVVFCVSPGERMSNKKRKTTPMTCPECSRAVCFLDVKAGRCPMCSTRICIPYAYFRSVKVLGVVITIVFVVETFSTFLTSPASVPLFTLWLVLILMVCWGSAFLLGLVSLKMFPPCVERVHANDKITVLHLDE